MEDSKQHENNNQKVVSNESEVDYGYSVNDDGDREKTQKSRENTKQGLSWHRITYTVHKKGCCWSKEKEELPILTGVTGYAPAGQLTAILGHSGAGKTTLLNILAGRIKDSRRSAIRGTVRINGKKVNPAVLLAKHDLDLAYVAQTDSLLLHITPREALRFSARMRLPKHVTEEEISKVVTCTLLDLRLEKVADNYSRHLSGGEKRRVSLGVELVTNPRIILIDEVTSGLDSHNAHVVMDVCRRVAQQLKMTLLLTIHQPNDEIFALMDRVIIMHRGMCMYEGEATHVSHFFEAKGLKVPDGQNALDWALRVSQTEASSELQAKDFFADHSSSDRFTEPRLSIVVQTDVPITNRISLATEMSELLRRDLTNLRRESYGLLFRFVTILVVGLLLAVCFKGTAKDSLDSITTFDSHVGIVYFIGFSCFATLLLVVRESCVLRSIFCREYLTGHYRMISFVAIQLFLEFMITFSYAVFYLVLIFWSLGLQGHFWTWLLSASALGLIGAALGHLLTSINNDPYKAVDVTPMVMSCNMLLSGFLVSPDSFPSYMRWAVWLPPLTYSFRLNLNNEFSVMCEPEDSIYESACMTYLETQRATGENNGIYWAALVLYFVFLRALSFFFIRNKAINLG